MLASFFADQLGLVTPSVLSPIKKGYHTSVPFFKDSKTNLSIGSKGCKKYMNTENVLVSLTVEQKFSTAFQSRSEKHRTETFSKHW